MWFTGVPYSFKSKDGDYIEREMSRDEVVDLPSEKGRSYVTFEGKRYYRSLTGGAVGYGAATLEQDWNQYPKISHALPGFAEGCEHTADGNCIIENKTQERELLRRHGFVRHSEFSDADYRRSRPIKPFIPVSKPKEDIRALREQFNRSWSRYVRT